MEQLSSVHHCEQRRRIARHRGQRGGCWETSLKRGEGKKAGVLRNYKTEAQREQQQCSEASQMHSSQLLFTVWHRAASQSEQWSATTGHYTHDLSADRIAATGGNQPVPNHCKHLLVPGFNKQELCILWKIQNVDILDISREIQTPQINNPIMPDIRTWAAAGHIKYNHESQWKIKSSTTPWKKPTGALNSPPDQTLQSFLNGEIQFPLQSLQLLGTHADL